ncbi:YvrJ family protein [Geosporobacter ferrireducens]|nr:YvrJ family protein [Geosporobacter ferrireducens]MTI54351.1 YvrJ family protein [Geosporobacter ferrireducens]
MEIFNDCISNLGFPIAVTAFLLIRIEKKLDELNKTLIQVVESLVKASQ